MDNLPFSTSAKLTDRASKRLLPLLPKSPKTDFKIELDQSKVLLNEPEIISLSVSDPLNEDPLKDVSATDNSVPTVKLMDEPLKLQCKWEGCYKTCDSQAALLKHIEEDHVRLQIGKKSTCLWTNCSRESKSFIKKHNLLLHMRLHCGEKPYKCPFQDCNKAFSQLKTLEIHQRRHTGEKPYSCQFPNCLKSFSSTTCMMEHQRTHFASNTYDCQVNGCSKKYTDRGGLWKHMKTHTVDEQLKVKQKSVEKKQKEGDFVLNDQGMHYDTKLYTCHCLVTGCSQKYTTSRSLWTHMKEHTVEEQLEAEQKLVKNTKKKSCIVQEEPSKNFEILQCEWEDCYQVHDCQAALVKHIEKNHIQFLKCKEFACFWSNCPRKSKPFISKRNLLTHIRVHSGEKPHKCQFQGCNKAFSRVDILKIHQRSHTGERPYLCQFPNCFKSFSDYSCRHKHQRTHFNTKPYVCQVSGCSKEYKDTSVLWKHLKKNHTVDEQLEHNQNRLKKLESDKNKQKEDDFIVYQI